MRATISELMDKLGVGYVPGPYESIPWSHYDSGTGITCSAEVRMSMDGDEVEAEIQFLHDTPPEGSAHTMEHICNLRAAPVNDGQWTTTLFTYRGQPYGQDAYDWEEKACLFFQLVVQDIVAEKFPDIEDLLDDAFHKREHFTGNSQGGGGKAPKIRPGQLLNPKGGRGF
jgi:hypothetical protein